MLELKNSRSGPFGVNSAAFVHEKYPFGCSLDHVWLVDTLWGSPKLVDSLVLPLRQVSKLQQLVRFNQCALGADDSQLRHAGQRKKNYCTCLQVLKSLECFSFAFAEAICFASLQCPLVVFLAPGLLHLP